MHQVFIFMPLNSTMRNGADVSCAAARPGFSVSPASPVSSVSSASPSSPQQKRFLQKLVARTSGRSEKPTDYAGLERLHQAWTRAGARPDDPRAVELRGLLEQYLGWAEHQHASRKLADHRRRAAGLLAEIAILPEPAADPRPTSTPKPAPPRSPALRGAAARPRSTSPGPSANGSAGSAGSAGSTGSTGSAGSSPSTAHRFAKGIGAAIATFRAQLNPPKPGSFTEVDSAYKRFAERLKTEPFKEADALQVRQLVENYLDRPGVATSSDKVQRAKHQLAAAYRVAVNQWIEKDRLERQAGIDKACASVHSPDLTQRTAARQKHAASMVAQFPTLNAAHDGTSERFICGADGTRKYRFRPMPTRSAAHGDDIGPQHAVLASVLHRKLVEQVGLDLRFPCATTASLQGIPGVLEDVVDLPMPEPSEGGFPTAELQRAVLAQWVLGRPRATWSDVGVDAEGRLRPRQLPQDALSPSDIANEGRQRVSPMINTQEPIAALHSPIDAQLAGRLLHMDIDALAKSMGLAQDVIDMQTHVNGRRAAQPPKTLVASHKDAVDHLLAPLRALQRALRGAIDARVALPLAMVLADAAEALPHPSEP